mgnify:CR=1 FL=1
MSDIFQIKSILESAVNNKYTVELRIEDKNTAINTRLTKVNFNTDNNVVIEAQGLRLMFQYEKCTMGSQSGMHDKFYFETDEVTVTVVVKM